MLQIIRSETSKPLRIAILILHMLEEAIDVKISFSRTKNSLRLRRQLSLAKLRTTFPDIEMCSVGPLTTKIISWIPSPVRNTVTTVIDNI